MKKLLEQYLLAFQIESIPQHIRDMIRELAGNPSWFGWFPKEWYDGLNDDQRNLVLSFEIMTLIVREKYKHSSDFEERISIVSYPRSANTFTRYIFEKLTNYKSMPLNGWPIDSLSDTPPGGWDESGIITKSHFVGDLCMTRSLLRGNRKEKVVLLLRNPVESFLRVAPERLGTWMNKGVPNIPRVTQPWDRGFGLGPGTGGDAGRYGNQEYFRNIECWLELPKDKRLLLTYEELVEKPKSFIKKAHSIVENPVMSVDEFMEDYDEHFESARLLYSNKLREVAHSSGKTVDKYSKQTSKEVVQKIWERTKEQCLNHEVLQLLEELYEERNKSQ